MRCIPSVTKLVCGNEAALKRYAGISKTCKAEYRTNKKNKTNTGEKHFCFSPVPFYVRIKPVFRFIVMLSFFSPGLTALGLLTGQNIKKHRVYLFRHYIKSETVRVSVIGGAKRYRFIRKKVDTVNKEHIFVAA